VLFAGLDRDYLLEEDHLGRGFVLATFLVGKKQIVGQHDPSSTSTNQLLPPALEDTGFFLKETLPVNVLDLL
jgi:hypothetical protein